MSDIKERLPLAWPRTVTDERIPEVIMDWVRMQKISKCKPKIN
jgi:hypothetical protein